MACDHLGPHMQLQVGMCTLPARTLSNGVAELAEPEGRAACTGLPSLLPQGAPRAGLWSCIWDQVTARASTGAQSGPVHSHTLASP